MQNSAHVRLIFVIIATSEKPLYLPILLFSVGVCFFFLLLMSHTMSTSLPHILHSLGRSFVLYSPSHDTHLMRQSLLSAISISLLSSLTIVTHNYFTFLFLCRIFRSTRCLLNKVFAPLGVFILLYVLRGFFVRARHTPHIPSHSSPKSITI